MSTLRGVVERACCGAGRHRHSVRGAPLGGTPTQQEGSGMELHHGLSMTPEMWAELTELRRAARDAKRIEQIRGALDEKGLMVPCTWSNSGMGEVRVDAVRERAQQLPSAFRRKVDAALDVIVERAQGLVDVAIDLDLFTICRNEGRTAMFGRYGYSSGPKMRFDRGGEGAEALCRAGSRILAALDEIHERVSLELLRCTEGIDANWFRRRAARRQAAQQLTAELALFLDALEEIPELTSVELDADDILRTRREADSEAGVALPAASWVQMGHM